MFLIESKVINCGALVLKIRSTQSRSLAMGSIYLLESMMGTSTSLILNIQTTNICGNLKQNLLFVHYLCPLTDQLSLQEIETDTSILQIGNSPMIHICGGFKLEES